MPFNQSPLREEKLNGIFSRVLYMILLSDASLTYRFQERIHRALLLPVQKT